MKSFLVFFAGMSALLHAQAQSLSALADSQDWHKLLVYEADRSGASGVRSAIHSPGFFLAEQGDSDPAAELQATLAAMRAAPAESPDSHAKCRFPARRLWLQQHLPEHAAALAEIDCPAFRAWAQPDQVDSISLVFANGFLDNPASYYGHTFLKFNHRQGVARSALLDTTLNYGAIQTQQDDPISYIVKGISGGYRGSFSPVEFYFHGANYGENEQRDLWEYRLALPEPALRLIIAHAWEVSGQEYTYYFFRRNCAYRVAELIEIASGLAIIPPDRPWVMPQALIQTMAATRYAGTPLVSATIYHPSRQSRLYQRYAALSTEERTLTANIIGKSATPAGPSMRALPVARQQAIIDILLDYYQSRLERGKREAGNRSPPEYVAALSARFALPPGDAPLPQALPPAPDSGRSPSYVQAGVSQTSAQGQQLELRIRPAYYDALDSDSAQPRNSALSMFDTYLSFGQGQWRLRRLDLLLIDNMNPALTGLPGDRGMGWRIAAGLDQERIGCSDCRVSRFQGDMGLSHMLAAAPVTLAVSAGGAIQHGARLDGWSYARLGASLIYRPSAGFGLRLAHERRLPLQGGQPHSDLSQVEARLALSRAYDLRLNWEQDAQRRLLLSLGRYW